MNTNENMEILITDFLHEIGIPNKIKGYQFLTEAILIALDDPSKLNSITKIYEEVGKKCGARDICVERNIRHAIEVAWLRGNVSLIQELFGYSIDPVKGKATNTEFISLIIDRLRLGWDLKRKDEKEFFRKYKLPSGEYEISYSPDHGSFYVKDPSSNKFNFRTKESALEFILESFRVS